METEKKWLNIRGAADHIEMSVSFIRKNVRLGTIPYTRVGSKVLRFDRNALDAWMAERSRGGEVKHGHGC